MDTIATKHTNQIQGQEGNIYIEDGGSGGLPVVFTHSLVAIVRIGKIN